jgi:hypothetical protein
MHSVEPWAASDLTLQATYSWSPSPFDHVPGPGSPLREYPRIFVEVEHVGHRGEDVVVVDSQLTWADGGVLEWFMPNSLEAQQRPMEPRGKERIGENYCAFDKSLPRAG